MRVLRASVHLELLNHLATQWALWQHATNRATNRIFGLALKQVAVGLRAQTAGVTAVVVYELGVGLAAGQHNLRRVDDHHVITSVHVRGEHRLVLAAQNAGHLGAHPTEYESIGVNEMPVALDVACFR